MYKDVYESNLVEFKYKNIHLKKVDKQIVVCAMSCSYWKKKALELHQKTQ